MVGLRRKIGFCFLAGVCLLISVFGISLGQHLLGSLSTQNSVVENVEDEENIPASATAIRTSYSNRGNITSSVGNTSSLGNVSFDACYFNTTGTIVVGNSTNTITFNDCYFRQKPTISITSGTVDLYFNRCIFDVSGTLVSKSGGSYTLNMTDCLDADKDYSGSFFSSLPSASAFLPLLT